MRPSRASKKGAAPARFKRTPPAVARVSAERTERTPERTRPEPLRSGHWLYGRHAVVTALANPARRWRRLSVLAGHEEEAATLVAAAQAERFGSDEPVRVLDRTGFTALLGEDSVHQGWALEVEPLAASDLDDVLRAIHAAEGRQIIVVLDQVTDPHNVGAVLRSAAAFGARAVVVAEHGAPPVGGVLGKAASGGLDLVPLVRVVNLARALDQMKEAGFWCCGLDEGATETLAAHDLGARVVLALGSEGGGLRRLVRERCDYLGRLPTRPPLASLNVSNAAAVALYELIRGESA